jgi:hypothetical protein
LLSKVGHFLENFILPFCSVKSLQNLHIGFFWRAYFLIEGIRGSGVAERFFLIRSYFWQYGPAKLAITLKMLFYQFFLSTVLKTYAINFFGLHIFSRRDKELWCNKAFYFN